MAFSVQDDNGGVADANAYCTTAYLQEYADDRGMTSLLSGADEQRLERAIVLATAYLDGRFEFVGWRQQQGRQTTQWPRFSAVDNDYAYVSGIPKEVKDATCEYAMRALPGLASATFTNTLNPDPAVSDTGALQLETRVKVGPIEEEIKFGGGGAYSMPPYPYADMILKKRGLVIMGHTLVRGA